MSLIHIYACGGTGTNIAVPFLNQEKKEGYADIRVTFCDTSTSNLTDINPPKDSVYLVKDKDGSGKVLKENANEIADSIPSLVLGHPPGDLNIIISSTTGGSGSVFMRYLLANFLANKVPVVVLLVNTSESKISIENADKAIKSLESIAVNNKAVVVSSFYTNKGPLDPDVDDEVRSLIKALTILYSGKNFGLDSKDLSNWVQPHKTIGAHPGVAWLRIITDDDIDSKNEKLRDPVSVAALYKSDNAPAFPHTPDFNVFGKNALPKFAQDLYFVISYEWVNELAGTIADAKARLDSASKARSKITTIRNDDDKPDADGMFL